MSIGKELRLLWKTHSWRLRPYANFHLLSRAASRISDDNERLMGKLEECARRERRLQAEVRALKAAPPSKAVSRTALGRPEFVLIGTDRDGRGKRIYSSRDIGRAGFGMTEMTNPPPRYVIDAIMENMLVLDAPDYGQAMDKMSEIWKNRERDAAAKAKSVIYHHAGCHHGGREHEGPCTPQAISPGQKEIEGG